ADLCNVARIQCSATRGLATPEHIDARLGQRARAVVGSIIVARAALRGAKRAKRGGVLNRIGRTRPRSARTIIGYVARVQCSATRGLATPEHIDARLGQRARAVVGGVVVTRPALRGAKRAKRGGVLNRIVRTRPRIPRTIIGYIAVVVGAATDRRSGLEH